MIKSNKELMIYVKKEIKTEEEFSFLNKKIISFFVEKQSFFIDKEEVNNITLNILSDLEEFRLDLTKNRYSSGSYYSPTHKINEILNQIEINVDKSYMDTSCGSGNFIIELLNRFSSILEYPSFVNFLENKIFAYDINEEALSILKTRIFLLIKTTYEKEYDVSTLKNICKKDFLLDSNLKVDFIIGNPPYLGVKSIEKSYAEKLKKTFNFIDDLYAMFIFKSINSLKENGQMFLITSNTWITISSKRYLRKLLIDNGLFKIIENNANTFNIKTNTSILFLNKMNNSSIISYVNENNNKKLKIEKKYLDKNYSFLIDHTDSNINLYTSYEKELHSTNSLKKFIETNIFKKLLQNEFVPIGLLCYIATGVDFKGNNDKVLYNISGKYNLIEDEELINFSVSQEEFKSGCETKKYIKAVKNEENIFVKWDKETLSFLRKIKAPLRNIDMYGKNLIYCNSTKLTFRKIDSNTICINTAGSCFFKPVFLENYEENLDIILKYLKENDFSDYLKNINNGLSFSPNDLKKIPFPTKLLKLKTNEN